MGEVEHQGLRRVKFPARVMGHPLRPIDRMLRSWRIQKIRPYLRDGCSVLDVGCYDGYLFKTFGDRIERGIGIDPMLERSQSDGRFRFIAGNFPSDQLEDERFDVITFLAVLEHVQPAELPIWLEECDRRLSANGLIVATVPSPLVDHVLDVLVRMRLVSGMSLEEHHGFDASSLPEMFAGSGFELVAHRRFEAALNNLFVFRKGSI